MTTYNTPQTVVNVMGNNDTVTVNNFILAAKITLDKAGSDPASTVVPTLQGHKHGGSGRETIAGGASTPLAIAGNRALHLGSDSLSGGDAPHSLLPGGSGGSHPAFGTSITNPPQAATDTIFGGSAHDLVPVHHSSVGATASVDHVVTITFNGGKSLNTETVKVVFNDHTKPH